MREEIEALEDHPDLLALLRDVLLAILDQLPADLAVTDEMAVHEDPAALDLLQVVHAANEGGLAGAGGPDDDDDLLPLDRHRDALEDVEPAEPLLDVRGLDHDLVRRERHAADSAEQIVGLLEGHHRPPLMIGTSSAAMLPRPNRRSTNARPRVGAAGRPLASFRSIHAWMTLQIVVSSRNQTAAAR